MAPAATHAIVPRRAAVAVLLLVLALSLVSATPVGVVAGLSGLAALAVMPPADDRRAWLPDLLAWLPVGVATALSAGTCVVIASGLLRVPLWGGWTGAATLAALACALATVAVIRGGVVGLWSPASALAWLPGLVLAGAVVFRFQQPMAYWSRPVWAVTDWMSHNEMVADLLRNRYLDYEAGSSSAGWGRTVYPRGLHALLAWLIPGGGDGSALALWEPAIAAVLAAALGLTIVAIVAAALLALTVGARLGLPTWLTVMGAVATLLLMLHPLVYQPLTAAGFLTTAGACMLLFATALIAADGRTADTTSGRVALMAMLTVGMFYLWQLLALPMAALTAYLAVRWWKGRRDHAWAVVSVVALGLLACLPLAVATLAIRRIGGQAFDGGFAVAPGVAAVVVSVGALALTVWRRRDLGGVAVAYLVTLPAILLMGVGIIPVVGGSVTDLPYYSAKLVWHAGVLALPVAIAGACYAGTLLAVAARDRIGGSPLIRGVVIAVPIVLLLAYVGGGASHGVGVTIRTLASPGGQSPQVPLVVLTQSEVLAAPQRPVLAFSLHPQGWSPSFLYTDWHAVQLARFLGAEVPTEGTLYRHEVGVVCEWLRRHADAVRLTGPTLGYRELLDDGCPESVVKPAEWVVVTTPQEWWRDTPWAATGGQAQQSADS